LELLGIVAQPRGQRAARVGLTVEPGDRLVEDALEVLLAIGGADVDGERVGAVADDGIEDASGNGHDEEHEGPEVAGRYELFANVLEDDNKVREQIRLSGEDSPSS